MHEGPKGSHSTPLSVGRRAPILLRSAWAIFTSIHAGFEAARTQLELAELAQARGDDERMAALRAALPAA